MFVDYSDLEPIEVEMEIRQIVENLNPEQLAFLASDSGLVGEAAREAFEGYGGEVNISEESGVIITETIIRR